MSDLENSGRIKGAAFREFVTWYGQQHGAGRLERAAEILEPEHGDHLHPGGEALGILPSTWYPAATVHALLDQLVGDVGKEERRQMAREAAQAIMQTTLRGIYGVLFRMMATPELYVRFGHRLWSMHYDSGTLELVMIGPNEMLSHIRDWDAHHPFICELNCAAPEQIFTEMGCKDVTVVQEACISWGDDACRTRTRWR